MMQFENESSMKTADERRIAAIALSRGVGVGSVVFYETGTRGVEKERIDENTVAAEVARFETAVKRSTRDLRTLAAENDFSADNPAAAIFAFHLSIIEDTSFIEKVTDAIQEQLVNAAWAVSSVADHYRERQIAVLDDRFREKQLDIQDVAERILTALDEPVESTLTDRQNAVIVSKELRPSQILEIADHNPAAIITERGGWTSHSAIVARKLQIPMVSGVKNLEETFVGGERVMVDGYEGFIAFDPQFDVTVAISEIEENTTDVSTSTVSTVTKDGVKIAIWANAEDVETYRTAEKSGAEGIALYRSEMLIGDRESLPSEEEQYEAYTAIADATGDHGVRIRTFDLETGHFDGRTEKNAALGLRSIRLSLRDDESFRVQIRAILRASFERNIAIVLPMVSGVAEIVTARALIDEVAESLRDEEIGQPRIGAMIEIPSAVTTLDQIAPRVDFVCLGTNDLVQYMLAVDRDNDAVASWYQSLHPAVLRSICRVIAAGIEAGQPVVVCGEMAGSPFYVPVLIGLGARELSMNALSIGPVRKLMGQISIAECIQIAEKLELVEIAADAEDFLREYYSKNHTDAFPDGLSNTISRKN